MANPLPYPERGNMPDAFFPAVWQTTNPLSYNQRDVYGSQNFSLWNSGNGEITNEPYQNIPL